MKFLKNKMSLRLRIFISMIFLYLLRLFLYLDQHTTSTGLNLINIIPTDKTEKKIN